MKINNWMHSSMKKRIQYFVILSGIFCLFCTIAAQGQDRIPREYTNPDEVVTFDRTTSFKRALDVINQFAQEYADKVILDRTGTQGNLGITVPPMHWQDALDLILRSKYLQLIEQPDYYEIVPARTTPGAQTGPAIGAGAAIADTALTTRSREVRINAIFFEGNRRALQEIGVDWSTLTENVPGNVGEFVNGQGGGSGGGQLPSTDQTAGGTGDQGFDGPFVSVNSKGAQNVSQNVFNALVNFGEVFGSGIRVQALFSAFEADNLGEILASPSVKVLEGEAGRIQVGQDFSIKQRDFAGNVTDQFFSVGTILEVTPRIIEQRDTTFLHLDIEAERSSAQPDPVSTVINKQNATTQTLLLDGEATVIAGLYRTEVSEVRRGVPILKDLPPWFFGLRYIFGYNSKDFQTRELVILIQAEIEDTIPERMNQEEFAGKYETLKNERRRIQNDILEYRKSAKEQDVTSAGEIDGDEDSVDKPIEETEELRPEVEDEPDQQQQTNEPQANAEITPKEIQLENTKKENDSDVPNAISNSDESFAYYVVGGSFKNKTNAENYRYRLDREGYPAEILVNVEDGFYMVAYRGFENRSDAEQFLTDIKRTTNENAWVYDNY